MYQNARQDIERRDIPVENGLVNTSPRTNALVPAISNGRALEDGLEEDGDADCQYESSYEVDEDLEFADAKDAHVEEEKGDFGWGDAEGEVKEFQDEEELDEC